MEAGSLRHRVTIQQKTEGSPQQNAAGEPDVSWTTYCTAYASINPVSGKEPFLAQQHLAQVSHKVRIRYRSGITADMRVLFGSRVLDIKAVLNWGERNEELLLPCEEGVNEG